MSSVAKKGLMQERGREDRKGKEEHEQVRSAGLIVIFFPCGFKPEKKKMQ